MGIVADGLGGHSCGETASEIVVSVFKGFKGFRDRYTNPLAKAR